MFQKALMSLWATCVFLTPIVASAANADIVLYATDSSNAHGNWALVADPTAAGGQALVSSDRGQSNTGGPLAAPTDYVEFTFTAPAATPYHVWLRMRAAADSKFNDSVFAQFSDAIDGSGAAYAAIGTTNGVTVNLAIDAARTTVSGWGWQDGAYWLTQPTTIAFTTGGSHTLRIQTREDGVSIDQVVLSPTRFLTTAPGAVTNDTTIVPKPIPTTSLPTSWSSQDVGSTGLTGSASFANSLFTVTGAGADIWGNADAFQFVSQAVNGDAQIVARVTSLQNVNSNAKAGVMFRDTSAPGSAHVMLDVQPSGSIEFMSRAATGAATSFLAGATQPFPTWLRLTRRGTAFTGEVSPDGATWTQVGITSVALAANSPIGLVVTSHDPTQRDTATFGNVVVTLPQSVHTDIVLYSTDSSNAHGNWARVADPTAAGGQTLTSIDRGVSNTAGPLATPIDYVDFTFTAPAGMPYHMWLRMRAAANAKSNDSVFAQFSDAIDGSGAALSAIGTTNGLALNLATDASGTSLSGWGWQDGAYWLTQPTTIAFAGGTHTLRIQTREDGVSIDQVVFSPTTFLTTAPGSATNDVTIVPKPGATVSQPPSVPRLPTPVDTATAVALGTQLTWSAAGATSYDVGFGTGNPPPHVATGLTSAAYTPSAMVNGTTYVWQVTAHNASGTSIGPVWSFTTIAVATVTPPAPATYNAISDRSTLVKPALPSLGAAGFTFVDPTFGTKMVRVTDGQTRPGFVNRSFREPSNAHLAAWNVNSTLFYVISNDGTVIPYAFNPATMALTRLQPGPLTEGGFVLTFYTSVSYPGDGGLTLKFYVEPQFSRVDPNIIFGAMQGSNNLTISSYNFEAGTYTTLIDLSTIVSGLSGTFIGGLVSGGTPTENLMTFFGGGSQDSHFYALWTPVANLGGRKLLNTLTSTINGVATNTLLNFHLHSAMIDKSGRFVFLYPTGVDLASPRNASQVYIWDTSTDTVTAITSGGRDGGINMHPGGHDAAGYGTWVNQDCCTSSAYDAAQWQFRLLTSVSQPSDLISPVMANKEVYLADHTTWNNAQPTTLVPVISSLYRYGANTTPWRAWDDEIIGIDTANGGGGLVYRFAHHRSLVASDHTPINPYFWYEPIANVSPDGKFVLFTSNWEKTLGTDSANDSGGEGTFREDVFVVQLTRQP